MIISSLQGIKADTLTFHRLHRFIRLILVAPLKKSATIQGEKCHYSRRKVPLFSRRKVPLFTVKRALFNTNYNVKKMINYYNKVIKNNNVKNAICGLFFNEKTNEMEYTVVYSI